MSCSPLSLALSCAVLLLPVRAAAQDSILVRPVAGGVLIDFQDADIRLVISALAEAGGLNVVYTDLPAQRVTLRMQQPIPRDRIAALLETFVRSNGLTISNEGAFLRVAGANAAVALGGGPAGDQAAEIESRLYVYRLKHARALRLSGTLQSVFGGNRATPAPGVSGLREVPLSQGLRQPPPLEPAQPQADAPPDRTERAGGGLPGRLIGDVQIVPDETTNSLLIRAQPADWEVIRQAVEALDLRPLQVLIEVVIAEVRFSREKGLSVSGSVADRSVNPRVSGTLRGESLGDAVLKVLTGGAVDLDVAIAALASRGEVRIISRPVILAQNNQEARILVGSERPFVQVSRSLPTDAAIRDQVIQFRDVGTKLTILPTINEDGYVNLEVLQEVSNATAESQFDAPIISTREAATHLFIRDGRTAVIGGLMDQLDERTRSGIPVLMDIPVIGGLFGSTKRTTIQSELFLFLTPHIVSDDEGMEEIREGLREGTELLRKVIPADSTLRLPIPPRP